MREAGIDLELEIYSTNLASETSQKTLMYEIKRRGKGENSAYL
jgi:hypothetical protein